MLDRVATFLCLVSAAAAFALPAPFTKPGGKAEPHYPALYEYEYSVVDEHNGDIKQQKENRNGDAVKGFYSLIQPDGVKRIVEYTVDKEHGFNAVVKYEGHPNHDPPKIELHPKVEVQPKTVSTTTTTKVTHAVPAPVSRISFTTYPVKLVPVKKTKVATTPAPIVHNAPAAKVVHSAPVVYSAAPVANVAYASPAHVLYSAPLARLVYAAPHLVGHVSYSSPAFSYHH